MRVMKRQKSKPTRLNLGPAGVHTQEVETGS